MAEINTPDKDQSLLSRFLTPAMREELKEHATARGFRLRDVIRSGSENPDSSIGVYAPDAESYKVFSPLFNKVIEAYHQFDDTDMHVRDLDLDNLGIEHLDPRGEFVISTRVRVGRNLDGFSFAPGITTEDRAEVERRVVQVLNGFTGDLSGNYHSLSGMDEETRSQMVADHFLFKQGDRFLESAGVNRDWPHGRGIFHSEDKQFLVWVNEEDQLRIISMEQGGDLLSVFTRLAKALSRMEKELPFAYSEKLGYLSSCPTNLGTAMRASVHIRLPRVSQTDQFEPICDELGLSIRGIHGEHSESEEGIYDISNKRRLGITEVNVINVLHAGVRHLIKLERALQ